MEKHRTRSVSSVYAFVAVLLSALLLSLAPGVAAAEELDVLVLDSTDTQLTLNNLSDPLSDSLSLDNEALLNAYAQQKLDAALPTAGGPRKLLKSKSIKARSYLTEVEQKMYDALKPQIEDAAAGNVTTTTFDIYYTSDLGYNSYYYVPTGAPEFYDPDTDAYDMDKLREAAKVFIQRIPFVVNESYNGLNVAIRNVVYALLADCPYELYWFDKTCGLDSPHIRPLPIQITTVRELSDMPQPQRLPYTCPWQKNTPLQTVLVPIKSKMTLVAR